VNNAVMWRFLFGVCELKHSLVRSENTAIFVMKVLDGASKYLVSRVRRRPGFV